MHRRTLALIFAALLAPAACGSGSGSTTTTSSTTTTAAGVTTTSTTAAASLTILVTNDDGIGAPGIDVLVNALEALDGVEVAVVAPVSNQSGTSDQTTTGAVGHADDVTVSGVAGTAVEGFPADTINVALDELGLEPDQVVSGINQGQNTGPLAYASGTVGAARTAARRGIPALAASAGLADAADYPAAAKLVVAWIESHRAELAAGTVSTDTVVSFNVPTCTKGTPKADLLEVPLATAFPEGLDPFTSDCTTVPASPPADDVAALAAGYAAQTLVPLEQP